MTSKPSFAYKKIVWNVPNITKELLLSEKAKGIIISSEFSIGFAEIETKWNLSLTPVHGSSSKMALFIYWLGNSTDFSSHIKFSLISSNEGDNISTRFERTGKEFEETKSHSYGQYLIKEVELIKNFEDYVIDGKMTIVCEITVHRNPVSDDSEESDESDESVKFSKEMFENDFLTDFVLETSDKETFNCHRFVLVTRSPVFMRMLSSGMREAKEGKVTFSDFDSNEIQEMLRFMYCKDVVGLPEIAWKLIYAAEKFELDDLKILCMESIIRKLDSVNVFKALKISHEISNAELLYNSCLVIVMSWYDEISKKDAWKELPSVLRLKISDSLFCSILESNILEI